jgi:putative nucleotide binding protein
MEEYARVVDFLPDGRSSDIRREPAVQIVGDVFFTLLEATLKPDMSVSIGQKVYIGKENRGEINKIKGKLSFEELTQNAKLNMPAIIKMIVMDNEAEYINFINKAGPISIRIHQLELLPGIGRKHLEAILTERQKKPFEGFADMVSRIHAIPDPAAIIAHRIINEFEGKERNYIFLKPFSIRHERTY